MAEQDNEEKTQTMSVEVKTDRVLNKRVSLESQLSPTLLPWDRFSNWIHCVCVVTFDLELGQTMEIIYPGHIRLTEKEKVNICYLSFPDSNSGCMGDTQFHFRIRQCVGNRHTCNNCHLQYSRDCPVTIQGSILGRAMFCLYRSMCGQPTCNNSHLQYNRDCPVTIQCDNAHYYGYVYFRQMKDRSIRRGYFQKSLVILTKMPFITLFTELAAIIAPEYFENGEPGLEAACHDIDQWSAPLPCELLHLPIFACHDIDQWSAPLPSELLHLPIFGTVIQVRVPSRSDKLIGSNQTKTHSAPSLPAHIILPSIHEVDMYSALQSVVPHIQMLWELVLIGEPIVVMASSPAQSSVAVEALISLISPLKHCYDYRPYFTIHDSEFREYTSRTHSPPPVILGVTNPFFAKTLQHWPHIIRVGDGFSQGSPKPFNKLKKTGNLKTLDSKPGVYTRYKPYLNCDKAVHKRLLKGVQTSRPTEAQNAILKRYILELTQSFMIPLERYMGSLMPLQRNICPHKSTPQMQSFDAEDFLSSLESSGPHLTTGVKGDWGALYRRFFHSHNFEGWYHQRQHEVNQKLQVLHLEALCNSNITEWVKGREEVEIVDLILRLRDKLSFARSEQVLISTKHVETLNHHLETIISRLPPDLQSVLVSW